MSRIEIRQTPNVGPPHRLRWLAFLGWLVLPVAATWMVVAVTGIQVLWWGPVWFGFALLYTIFYFRWARKRYPKNG